MYNELESMGTDEKTLEVQVQEKLVEGRSPEDVAKDLGITVEEVKCYGGIVWALTRAIDECIEEGILTDFLSGDRTEVLKTLLFDCREFQTDQM